MQPQVIEKTQFVQMGIIFQFAVNVLVEDCRFGGVLKGNTVGHNSSVFRAMVILV